MSKKPSDENKLIERMRTNTEAKGPKTGARPYCRTRRKVPKIRPKDDPGDAATAETT